MPTTTSLNLQALLKTASARTGMDQSASSVRGLSPSAQALYVAIRASHRKSALALVIVPTDEDVDRFVGDVRFFMGALEGASAASLDDVVKPFPWLQIDPYRRLAPHFHIASARAAALHGLATGSARIVIASGAALLPRLSHPDRLRSTSIDLKPGMELGPIELGDLLADAGFTREDPVDEHGEFTIRGGKDGLWIVLEMGQQGGGKPGGELHIRQMQIGPQRLSARFKGRSLAPVRRSLFRNNGLFVKFRYHVPFRTELIF